MTRPAPTWALNAAALDAGGDPHLQPGVHVRVLPGPGLGLPLAPLLVSRTVLGPGEKAGDEVDVVWTDPDGEQVFPPFALDPERPVTGWLDPAPHDPVLWAVVLVADAPKRPGPGDVQRPFPIGALRRSGVRVDALVSGVHGSAVVATATGAPYQVAATGMDRVEVRGRGRVTGIRVLRASVVAEQPGREWRLLALPVERGARYQGIDDAMSRARDRVLRGAPQRLGLHDEPHADHPMLCSLVGQGEEIDRVEVLWRARLEAMVDVLVNDLSDSPSQLLMPQEPLAGTAAGGTLRLPALAGVLQGALDPGVGRLLGLVEHDEAPAGSDGDIAVYTVRGAWALRPRDLGPLLSLLTLGPGDDPDDFPLPLPELARAGGEGLFADLWTAAAVVLGAAAPRPAPPGVGPSEDLGWLPEVPPSAHRHVVLAVSGLVPAAALAVAAETAGVLGLNPRLPEVLDPGAPDRAVAIVPGVLAEVGPSPAATAPGQGEVHDRAASAKGTTYRVAQADWFGRWSTWAHGSIGDGVRPAVPVPVLEASYLPPAVAGAPGELEVRCAQPRDRDLAPGSFPLERLVVSATVGAGPPVAGAAPRAAEPPPGADATPLAVRVTVPPLAPAEKRWLLATARWEDTAGRLSEPSPPTRAQAADPRAPAALTLPNTLVYGSRPDALGRSRVQLRWPAQPAPTAYRVYHADETTLRTRLESLTTPAAAAARSSLAAARTAPDRAAVFRDNAGLFDRSCFELLTASPLLAPAGGQLTYEHSVSGSLRVLLFYRVVPLSDSGAEAAFTLCTLLPRGIPNTPPPPTPSLEPAADPADPTRVVLTVTVPAGAQAPVAVRLRRSRVTGADALSMPVVATATPATWPAVLSDRGGAPWDASLRFSPWSTYTWRAEVQGQPEPGSTLPGAWSQPSAPVSWRVVPPPPLPATAGTATPDGSGVVVRFGHPEPLDGGPAGTYVLDVYRRVPPGSTSSVASGSLGSHPAAALRQPDGSYEIRDTIAPPAGTVYLVEVADPLDRRSPRAEIATL